MSRRRSISSAIVIAAVLGALPIAAAPDPGEPSIAAEHLKQWLTYIASDELEGRAVFSTGLGLAAGYIEDHLRQWGAVPAGSDGSYLQTVRVLGVKRTPHSTVTVSVGGRSRTFADGEGVTFQRNVGGPRHFTIDRVEFAGYGLENPAAHQHDFRGKDVKGAAVVWLGASGPKGLDLSVYRRLLSGRRTYATEQLQAAASIGPQRTDATTARQSAESSRDDGGRAGSEPSRADFTTVQRLDAPIAPNLTATDALLEFLFSRAPVKYDDLKRKAAAQDPLPTFRLANVTLAFDIEADYEIVRTRLTHNVVAIVEGSGPELKHTYVAFGAHYDHIGYAEGEVANGANGPQQCPPSGTGVVRPGAEHDRIWNGADDDGSGTVALMELARAFSQGPRPRRSLLFVWHAGEECGLYGSRYFADYPTVPLESIVALVNIDMIGRNRNDNASEANTVYLVGSDRISSELDATIRAANQSLPQPLHLDYHFNDPFDPEQLYFRSDHFSYASKGIPIVFLTTGLHPDYHANTDDVSKIEFGKMTRIVQLAYAAGLRLANLDHPPVRDNKGARTVQ